MVDYSIIVCAFNEEEHIGGCVKSLLNQDELSGSYEILVMDNSSNDATFEIVKALIDEQATETLSPKVRLIKIKHVGLSASRNTGVEHATGKYIAFVDGDAKVESNWLREFDSEVKANSNSDVFAGAVHNLSGVSEFSDFIYEAHVRPAMECATGSKLVGANMIYKRDVFNLVRFLDGMTRGDEACLLEMFKEVRPDVSEVYVANSIVYNEYPNSLSDWLKVMKTEGEMRSKISLLIQKKGGSYYLESLFRFLHIANYPMMVGLVVMDLDATVFALIAMMIIGVFAVRFKGLRSYFIGAFKSILNSRFRRFFILTPFVCLLGVIARDYGALKYLVRRVVNKDGLSFSVGEVIDVYESH